MRRRISNIRHRTANLPRAGISWNPWFWLSAFLFLAFSNPSAEAQVSREYQLKAAFLYNFAQFTDWPENAFADTNAPIVIGIFGSDPFGPALPETIRGE